MQLPPVTKETGFLWFCGGEKVVVEGVPAVLKTAEEIPLEKWVELKSKLKPCGTSMLPGVPGVPSIF